MSHNYLVYWIHAPYHTDYLTEGYVGLTKNFENRWQDHCRRGHMSKKIAQHGITKDSVIFLNTNLDKHSSHFLEAVYRPHKQIGWNRSTGGAWTAEDHILSARKKPDYSPIVSCIHCKKSFNKSSWHFHEKGTVIKLEDRSCWPLAMFLRHHATHRPHRKNRSKPDFVSCIHCKRDFSKGYWNQHNRGTVIKLEDRSCWPISLFLRHHKSHRA